MSKVPTRSQTHREVDMARLAGLGLELDEIAVDDKVALKALVEMAEDRGRPASHYLAGMALATDFKVADDAPTTLTFCAGKCQNWGALDALDRAVERCLGDARGKVALRVVSCLDRCDEAAVFTLDGPAGTSVIQRAKVADVDEAIAVALS